MKRIIGIVLISFMLCGCAVFESIRNPITLNQIAVVKSSYGVALSIAVAYRNTRLCKKNEVATITNICAYRSVILKLQDADLRVQVALSNAEKFIKDNPTLDAFAAIQAVQLAVDAFKSVERQHGLLGN